MTQVNGSLLGLTASSRKWCGLGIWNPETLRAGCDLTQPLAGCHRGSFSCSLCRDNLQHLSILKHVDAPQAIIQQYWLGEHCRFRFTANVVWSQSYFDDSTVYSLCPFVKLLPIIFFLYQFSTSFPSFSLDVSRAALFSACESVVATLFWKHLFRDFLDYCLFFVLLLHKIQPHKRKMKSNKNNDVLSVSGLVCSWYCKPLPPVSLLVLKSRRFFQEGSTFTAAA